jgi:RimJ/RimL family protein N-acetyltransferase
MSSQKGMTMEHLFLRNVSSGDMEGVFALSNEDYVRQYSVNKERITWEEHVRWFTNILQDRDNVFYVITDHSERFLGQIRYRIENDNAIVSISLSNLIMGKGLSRQLLLESINKLFQERKEIKVIIAYVSENNIASDKLFKKAGFFLEDKQQELLKYIYPETSTSVN